MVNSRKFNKSRKRIKTYKIKGGKTPKRNSKNVTKKTARKKKKVKRTQAKPRRVTRHS